MGMKQQPTNAVELTERQRNVVKLRCEGHNIKMIAVELAINEKTVAYHWARACAKIGRFDPVYVTQWALKNGVASWVV